MSQTLVHKAGKNVIWSTIEGFSVQFIQFVISIIIARIVSPDEFGLIAMLSIFLAVAQVFVDSGFSTALIQKQDRNEVDYSTAFYFNLLLSVFVYLVLFLIAPIVASFYNQEILTLILRCVALNIVISSVSIVQRSKLVIEGDFKLLAKVSLIAVIVSGTIGLYYAYQGLGVWALVLQSVSNQFFITLFLWIHTKWIPCFTFSKLSFISLFSFGSKVLLSGLINVIYVNMYTLIIGKVYSPQSVGYYSRANMFAQFPSVYLTSFIVRAIYPIQCEFQNDEDKFLMMIYKYIRLSTFLIFPVMIGLCAVSKPLIYTLLTEKWSASIDLLMILCMAYLWRPVMGVNEVLNAKGRSDLFLRAEVVKKITAAILLIVSFPFGIKCMCYSLIAYNLFDMFIILYYIKKITSFKIIQMIKDILPFLALSIIAGIFMYLPQLFFTQFTLQLVVGVMAGFLLYIGMAKLFKFQEITIIITVLKNFLPRCLVNR